MLKELVNRMQGQVRLRVEAAFPERVLNLCGARHLSFWDVEWESATVFTCRMGRRDSRVLRQAVREMDCTVTVIGREGAPYFLLRFRRRYALLAGVALCLVLFAIGSRTVLTIEVTGNETVTREEIISQLRLCGVSVGTYGPGIPIREVENRMMMAMDALSYFSLNLHGTRAEVIVREGDPAPEIRAETVPTDVVSSYQLGYREQPHH